VPREEHAGRPVSADDPVQELPGLDDIEVFFGILEYEFEWLPKSNTDQQKQMTTLTGYVNAA